MLDDIIYSVTLWGAIAITAGAALMLVMSVVPRREGGMRARARARRQRPELLELLSKHVGDALELDWVHFKDIPDTTVRQLAAHYGWHYEGEEIGKKSWILRFRQKSAREGESNPGTRLQAELRKADPGHDGYYTLDTSEYEGLGLVEIKEFVQGAGLQVAEVDKSAGRARLRLVRGEQPNYASVDPASPSGAAPGVLRQNRRVAARAEKIRKSKGFDPLSEEELHRVRQREKYWQKKFLSQVVLASFYTIMGGVLLTFLFSGYELDWHEAHAYVLMAIPVILLLLGGIAVYKAVRARKGRRVEVGEFLDAYEELNRIAALDG